MSAALKLPFPAIEPQPETSLLRVLTCGSVDDGKSTLLGRLLFDSHAVLDDQLSTLDQDSRRWGTQGEGRDFALLVDGLAAEREQGITIDVAYRYFSTPRRSFIVADTPGHEQYTRNMATGASTAELAIILVDARKGVLPQTRRHAFIVATLGVRHAVLAINKMDLVGYSAEVFSRIAGEFGGLAGTLDFRSIVPIPICARDGDNVASRSEHMPWYAGPTLLDHLETVTVAPPERSSGAFRLPVQLAIRPNADFRGYAGTLTAGTLRVGEPIQVQPSGERAKIARIVTAAGERDQAEAGDAVTVTLTAELDVSRGDVIASADDPPAATAAATVRLLWMEKEPLGVGQSFIVQIGTAHANATVSRIQHAIDIESYEPWPAAWLGPNEIGSVELTFDKPLVLTPYGEDRTLGALILVDRLTNRTVAMAVVDKVGADTPARRRSLSHLWTRPAPARLAGTAVIWTLAAALTHDFAVASVLGLADVFLRPIVETLVPVRR